VPYPFSNQKLLMQVMGPPPNIPPDCESAVADPDQLWPPNHEFTEVGIVGVTDPDGDPITITINTIFQDEPTVGIGEGNTCPDGGGIGTDVAEIRSERSGLGNGRVYRIYFTATDDKGGSCTFPVFVCVPHDQAHDCVDEGATYDSTYCNGS
jgi:hypothetical protein